MPSAESKTITPCAPPLSASAALHTVIVGARQRIVAVDANLDLALTPRTVLVVQNMEARFVQPLLVLAVLSTATVETRPTIAEQVANQDPARQKPRTERAAHSMEAPSVQQASGVAAHNTDTAATPLITVVKAVSQDHVARAVKKQFHMLVSILLGVISAWTMM